MMASIVEESGVDNSNVDVETMGATPVAFTTIASSEMVKDEGNEQSSNAIESAIHNVIMFSSPLSNVIQAEIQTEAQVKTQIDTKFDMNCGTQIIDEEITVKSKDHGLVDVLVSRSLSNDVFYTPMASEEALKPSNHSEAKINKDEILDNQDCKDNPSPANGIKNISKESVPDALGVANSDLELIAFSSSPHPPRSSLRSNVLTTAGSLLDWEGPLVTPTSQPKYSERQWQERQRQWEERLAKQTELYNMEVTQLESKYEQARATITEMHTLLEEYERTVENLLLARLRKAHQNSTDEDVELDPRDKDLLLENQSLKISLANMRLQYEETKGFLEAHKSSEQSLAEIVAQLKQQLNESQKTYNALVAHSQSRLSEANEELARVRSTLEIELSATKAKLSKAELRLTSIESAMEVKTRENKELATICDELIMKIDGQPSPNNNNNNSGVSTTSALSTYGTTIRP